MLGKFPSRAALCGLAAMFALASWAATGAAAGARRSTAALASACQAKLARIAANETTPPPHPDVILTAAEANAYFAGNGARLPKGVSHLALSSQPDLLEGSADIDFDQLPHSSASSLAGMFFSGVHHVAAQAHLDSGQAPQAELTVEQVTFDGETIPNFLLDLAIREFIQPKHPEISRHFPVPLPKNVRSVSLGADQVVLHY